MTKIDILNYYRKIIEKSRSFCAAHLNVKRTDIFLIIAVIAILAYIIANHSCEAVHAPARINIVI